MKPQLQAIAGGKSRRKAEVGDIAQMAASQKARLLSSRWDMLAVNLIVALFTTTNLAYG